MKKAKKFLNLGMGTYMGATVVGALPNPSNNANVNTIKGNMGAGYANFSSAFPAVGAMAGTAMTIKYAKNLTDIVGRRKKKK